MDETGHTMKHVRIWSVWLTSGLVGVGAALAQPMHPREVQAASGGIVLTGSVEFARLLDLCAQRLNVAIDYDPAMVRGLQVTLRSSGGISDAELWGLTARALAQKGLTTIRQPGSKGLTLVKLEEAGKLARSEPMIVLTGQPEMPPLLFEQPVAGFVNTAVRCRFLSSKDAQEILRPILSRGNTGGAGGAGAGTPSLNVTTSGVPLSDLSFKVEEAIVALQAADIPENQGVIEEISLTHISAAQCVPLLSAVLAKRELALGEKLPGEVLASAGGSSMLVITQRRNLEAWTTLIAQVDQREGISTVAYSPRIFAVSEVATLVQQSVGTTNGSGTADERFKVVAETPTGTLLVTATESQHAKVRELMDRLDAVPGEARRPMRSFSVRNRSVEELIAVLDKMIAAGALESTDTPAAATGSNAGVHLNSLPVGSSSSVIGGTGAAIFPLASNTNPVPARNTSANRGNGSTGGVPISITADEATNTIIAIGDARLLQQLETLIKTLDVRQPQVMLEVMLVSMTDSDARKLGVQLQQQGHNRDTTVNIASIFGLSPITGLPTTGGGTGFNGTVLNPGDFQVVVNALQTVDKGRSVSLPKVLVTNNQRSVFNSVEQVPFAVSFAVGNASSPSSSFGGTQDAGTELSIKPQISDGDTLLIDYSISISTFIGDPSSAVLPPKRSVNRVQSMAVIPDGYTVVVGGIEKFSEGGKESRVPLLGEIPVIGEAFKNQSASEDRSKFYVFIRASVMRDQSLESLRYLSDRDTRDSGLPDTWPRSKPRVIK